MKQRSTRSDPRFMFVEGEKVLCFHGPLLYEAKILQVQTVDSKMQPDTTHSSSDTQVDVNDSIAPTSSTGEPFYYVHYHGWKSSWDEWVPQSRMVKHDADGLKRQADLNAMVAAKKAAAASGASSSGTSKSGQGRGDGANGSMLDRGKKRRRDSILDKNLKDEPYFKQPEIKIVIPELLKQRLVDDWENVTKNHKLVPLPRDITVAQTLDKFRQHVESTSRHKGYKDSTADNVLNEVIEGLKLYFDKALGTILLYRFEREQYVDVLSRFKSSKDEIRMSQIYGPEHLLRLFVQMPVLITHTSMDQDAIQILTDYFGQILAFLQKHHDELFLSDYDIAPPEYVANHRKPGAS